MPVDKFGRMSDTKTKDTGVSLTYINNNYIRNDGSTPVTGSIDMGGNKLYNVSYPVNPNDVATKDYADYVLFTTTDYVDYINNNNIRSDGSTPVTGSIDMGGNKLYNVSYPVNPNDVASKEYVDNNKRKHIIAVSTNCYGDLTKREYQFAFGGIASRETGFLMPHSVRIKKIEVRLNGEWVETEEWERSIILYGDDDLEIFSIRLFKKDTVVRIGELPLDGITLGKIKCNVEIDKVSFKKRLCFAFIANDLKNNLLSEGDYINIRSEITFRPYTLNFNFFYLVTFLIELDPL